MAKKDPFISDYGIRLRHEVSFQKLREEKGQEKKEKEEQYEAAVCELYAIDEGGSSRLLSGQAAVFSDEESIRKEGLIPLA